MRHIANFDRRARARRATAMHVRRVTADRIETSAAVAAAHAAEEDAGAPDDTDDGQVATGPCVWRGKADSALPGRLAQMHALKTFTGLATQAAKLEPRDRVQVRRMLSLCFALILFM